VSVPLADSDALRCPLLSAGRTQDSRRDGRRYIRSNEFIMKKALILVSLLTALLVCTNIVSAQKKQRIGLAEGADSVSTKGKISGKQYALYEIWVEKGDSWSVKLNSANNYIGYTVKDASGNRYDFLEETPVSGYYTIRVELNSTGAKSKAIANFTLDIKFEMEKNKPLSE
jgi:hypothetical protein